MANVAPVVADIGMQVDQNAQSREAQNRLREQHRSGRDNLENPRIPSQPRGNPRNHDEFFDRHPRQMDYQTPNYQQGYGGFYGGSMGARPYDDGGRYGGGQWR